MSDGFKIEIINPEKSFYVKENISEVIVPAFEGEMGILKDHIPIIFFLKPGIVKVIYGTEEEKFYADNGIVEFKDNSLCILTSSIINLKEMKNDFVKNSILAAEKELGSENLDDHKKFLLNQKIDALKYINVN
tara:strand:- start:32061 stop:32459 length:399 start_codon:yes stop_codon:yes gene_type:complete